MKNIGDINIRGMRTDYHDYDYTYDDLKGLGSERQRRAHGGAPFAALRRGTTMGAGDARPRQEQIPPVPCAPL